jgi:hypothetical protein
MKPVQYDRHAKRRMKDREVSQEEIELTLKNPDLLEQSIKGRTNAFNFLNDRYLRVTFKEEANRLYVITVTVRKKPFGGQYENRIQ